MNNSSRRLGKGLGALLGESVNIDELRKPVEYINKTVATPDRKGSSADIMLIPVDSIEPNPFQPRSGFDQETLDELAASIRSLGLIQPITVRRTGGRYQIISGERRYRACRLAGMTEIPAYVKDTDDTGMIQMAIVENIQREDLDPIEVALGYRRLIEECDLTQEQMADRVGKNRVSVTNYLRLLKLPAKVQHDLKVGLISVGHAKVLLGAPDEAAQERLCDMTVKEGLSVKQLEERLRRLTAPGKGGGDNAGQDLPDSYFRVLELMGRYFNSSISLKRSKSGKGTMTVHFNSDEEMAKFLKALEDSEQ